MRGKKEKTVTGEVNEDLTLDIDMDGFVGDACLEKAEEILKYLKQMGVEVDEDDFKEKLKRKREFYEKRDAGQVRGRR